MPLLLLGGVASCREKICALRPLAYWPLDEQAGTIAYDSSGNARNGAYTGVTFNVPGANLIANPGFETAGGGGADVFAIWNDVATDGAIADETTLVHGGGHAAKLTAGAAATTKTEQSATVLPNRTYQFSAWLRGDGTNGGRWLIEDASHGWATLNSGTGTTGTTYQQVTAIVTTPDGTTGLNVKFLCPVTNGGIAYFDDVLVMAPSANGIGDGRNAPFFDGTNDVCNVYSTSLRDAFNGAAGTLYAWVKVSGAGVWTDAVYRNILRLQVDANNLVDLIKNATNNQLGWSYAAGGVWKSPVYTPGSPPTGWFCIALTWSVSADQVKGYYNGAQIDTTKTTLGTWAGSLASTTTTVGAASTTPANPWSGTLAHCAVWNRALTPAEIASLAVV